MRQILVLLTLIALLITPAAAQVDRPASTGQTAAAALVPADAAFFLAGRADSGYLETLKSVWMRLDNEVFGSSDFPSYDDVFGNGTLGAIFAETTAWRGDTLAVAALAPASLLAMSDGLGSGFDIPGLVILISVTDRAAADAWMADQNGLVLNDRANSRYAVYTAENSSSPLSVLLSDDYLIITTSATYTAQLLSGDYPALSQSAPFTAVTGDLAFGAEGYDILGYLDAGALVREANTQEFITREMTPYRQFRFALADFAGQIAFGGVYQNGQDLIIDGAWRYGDPAALADYGFDPSRWATEPIDPLLMAYLPPETQFILQSTDLDGTLQVIVDGLNAVSQMLSTSPELSSDFSLFGMQVGNLGGLLRGSLTVGFAGLTGLNLQQDVLALLNDTDYALSLRVSQDNTTLLGYTADAALIARHTGGAQAWLPALSEALALYGYPDIAPQPFENGDGQVLDFGPVLDTFTGSYDPALAADPRLDPLIGVNSAVAVLGTRHAVEYALAFPTDLSNVRIGLPRAVTLYLPNAQAVGYVNGESLQTAGDGAPIFESATFSAIGGGDKLVGRLTLSLLTGGR